MSRPGPAELLAAAITTAVPVLSLTWDIGKAIGPDPAFDLQLTGTMLSLYQQTIAEDFRVSSFAPAIPVPDSATDPDKRAGFLGRQP
jgi:hypothetical protein